MEHRINLYGSIYKLARRIVCFYFWKNEKKNETIHESMEFAIQIQINRIKKRRTAQKERKKQKKNIIAFCFRF